MEVQTEGGPPSQASSHFPLESVSAATLFELEVERRRRLEARGRLLTGCDEIDRYVLCGGLERGIVVGISAEEGEMGLLLGLQTVARSMAAIADMRTTVITTLAAPVILPQLRDVVKAHVHAGTGNAAPAQIRQCLERISISRVFDIEGLCEVLRELEEVSGSSMEPSQPEAKGEIFQEARSPASAHGVDAMPGQAKESTRPPRQLDQEIEDSQEEEEEDSSLSSVPTASPPNDSAANQPQTTTERTSDPIPADTVDSSRPSMPDTILITHFSTLLSQTFSQREKSSAHTALQLLSSHLHFLARTTGTTIILLNTTTSPSSSSSSLSSDTHHHGAQAGGGGGGGMMRPGPGSWSEKSIDPSLRSIFNLPPTDHAYGGVGGATSGGGGSSSSGGGGNNAAIYALAKRNKPSFGLTFTQFLHLHLLCTKIPRSRTDAEALFTSGGNDSTTAAASSSSPAAAAASGPVKYAWVVEVLLDERGVPGREEGEGEDGRAGHVDREQRWAAVDVQRGGTRIVNAFEEARRAPAAKDTEPIRLPAGFGGRRV